MPFQPQRLDTLPIVAFISTSDGTIREVSPAWTAYTGHSADATVGRPCAHFFEAADAERIAAAWNTATRGTLHEPAEVRLRLSDGSTRWVLMQMGLHGDPGAAMSADRFVSIVDFDDRKRAALAAAEREEVYRAVSEALPGVTWIASPAGDLTHITNRWPESDPSPTRQRLGDAWIEIVHPDDRERVKAAWSHAVATGEPYSIEFRVAVGEDAYHWFLVRAQPVFERGSLVRWVGVNIDIDDLHAADETRDLYAALVENSMDFIGIVDRRGAVVYVNSAGRGLLGIESLDAARETPVLEYFVPEDRAFVRAAIFPAIERDGYWNGDFQFRHFITGAPVPVGFNVFTISANDGRRIGSATVSRDRRERKRVEDGLRLLSRTGAAVVDSLDYQRTLQNIARAFVDGFAAYCLIDVMPARDRWERTAEHRDPAYLPLLLELSRPTGNHPIARAIEAGESSFMRIDDDWARNLRGYGDQGDPKRLEAIRRLHVRSIISVPVVTPSGDVVGALTCALDDETPREEYGPDDLGFVQEVGRRAGAAIANVQLYERERRIALELQNASLPARLPNFPGVVLDAAYRPGSNEAKIGGDWYDAFVLSDDRLMITVGDVLGHGLQAAVSMTKLRLAMQSAARVDPDPNLMLRVADATLRLSDTDAYATALAAVYDARAQTVTFASAGHPAPMLRTVDGRLEEASHSGLMIGLRDGAETATTTIVTPPGSMLVFYTDGLVEVVRDMDEGYARLSQALLRDDVAGAARPAEAIVDAVLGSDAAQDDIAVLVVRFV